MLRPDAKSPLRNASTNRTLSSGSNPAFSTVTEEEKGSFGSTGGATVALGWGQNVATEAASPMSVMNPARGCIAKCVLFFCSSSLRFRALARDDCHKIALRETSTPSLLLGSFRPSVFRLRARMPVDEWRASVGINGRQNRRTPS